MSNTKITKDLAYYLHLPYTIVMHPDEEGDFIAQIQELPGCMADGSDPTEAVSKLREVQEAWISECLESGRPIPEPENEDLPSGKWVQRVPRTLHRNLADLAKREQVSLNQLVTSMLSEAVAIRPWRDYQQSPNFGVAIQDMGKLHPWEALAQAKVCTGWIFESPRKSPLLLAGLIAAQHLLPARNESTDAYDPKTGFSKKELADLIRR